MFGLNNAGKNTITSTPQNVSGGKFGPSINNVAEPEKFPIRTMKKDLENINNPDYINSVQQVPVQKINLNPSLSPREPLTVQEKSSPFLEKVEEASSISFQSPASNSIPTPIPKTSTSFPSPTSTFKSDIPSSHPVTPFKSDAFVKKLSVEPAQTPTESERKGLDWKKILFSSIVVFLVILSGVLGYYYWMKRQAPSQVTTTVPAETAVAPEVPEKPKPPLFSQEKPNYLSFDFENSTALQIKAKIKEVVAKVQEENMTAPVEFVLTDPGNNPITLKKFVSKAGISFSPELLEGLEDNFSLFIYIDNSKARLGFTIPVKNKTGIKELMKKEEKAILEEAKFIYLVDEYTINTKPLSTSTYGTAEIRFNNIISPEDLSFDYTIYKDTLIIGTTKMTLRSILDYMDSHSASPETLENGAETE